MNKPAVMAVAATFAVTANAQWSDNFDTYINGQQLHGLNGWEGWLGNPAYGALVTDAQSSTAPHSVEVVGPNVDVVNVFTGATSGLWLFSGEVYVPGNYINPVGLGSMFIMLNEYVGTQNWSVQMQFDSISNNVLQLGGSGNNWTETQTPIVRDQWVVFDFVIDLDGNTVLGRYNNITVLTGQWYNPTTGTAQVAAIDLFAWNSTAIYYDNLQLSQVPEPATFVALGIGLAGLLALRRRK